MGVPGAVDRPERPPQSAGEYLAAGTTLKLKISLSHPLVPVHYAPRLLPLPQQVSFSSVCKHTVKFNKEKGKKTKDKKK